MMSSHKRDWDLSSLPFEMGMARAAPRRVLYRLTELVVCVCVSLYEATEVSRLEVFIIE